MPLFRYLLILFCVVSVNIYAYERPYVTALSAGTSDDNQQFYGISSYETLGKGRWGIYGEMLFAYQSDTFQNCGEACDYVENKDSQLNFTVGGSYGLTHRLYGLLGVGIRIRNTSNISYNEGKACDHQDDPVHLPSAMNDNGDQYCLDNREVAPAGQVGLLYVTPLGVSFSGTVDTQKTAVFSIGYQF